VRAVSKNRPKYPMLDIPFAKKYLQQEEQEGEEQQQSKK
jgi:hypothetical protein